MRPEELVESIARDGLGLPADDRRGDAIEADAVVAGLGIVPNTELAEAAGLEVDDGILVDELRTRGWPRRRLRGRRRRALPGARARRDEAGRARGSREHARPSRRRQHGRRETRRTTTCRSSTPTSSISATRPSGTSTHASTAVEEWAEPNRKGVVGYVDDDGKGARVPALGRLGQGRRRARAHPRRRDGRRGAFSAPSSTEGRSRSSRSAPRARARERRRRRSRLQPRSAGCLAGGRAPGRRLPRPGSERGPVDLERRDDEEDSRVDRPPCPQEHEDEQRAADRARDVGGGQHGEPERAPTVAAPPTRRGEQHRSAAVPRASPGQTRRGRRARGPAGRTPGGSRGGSRRGPR